MTHVRKPNRTPKRNSRNWAVLMNGETKAATLCGADVTDRDMTLRDAKTKKHFGSIECPECRAIVERLKG